MDIKNQIKQFNKIIHKLYLENEWETSKRSRLLRAIRFHLGFSQCRYCTYFQPKYGNHQTRREESILTNGKCDWSNIAGVEINKEMATRLKRCDGFVPALFNVKGYSVPKEEVKDILLQRRNYFFSWGTIVVAIIAATIAWSQVQESKKERVKAESALINAQKAVAMANEALTKTQNAENNTKLIAEFMLKLVMVDQSLGYAIDSFAVRQEASPLLKEKAEILMKRLNIPLNYKLSDTVQEWLKLPDNGEQKKRKWEEIKMIINKLFNPEGEQEQ